MTGRELDLGGGIGGAVRRAEELSRRLTPEQVARREVVAERQRVLQAGIVRGPNAPRDGAFGGVRKS